MDTFGWLIPLIALLQSPPTPHCALAASVPTNVRAVAITPDAHALAAVAADRVVRVWEVRSRRERLSFTLASPVSEIAFSPDGHRLATICNRLELWDADSGKPAQALPEVSANQLAFAPSGSLAVAGHRLTLLCPGTLAPGREFAEQAGWLNTCVAFSSDEKLVAAGDQTGNVWVWEVATRTIRLRRKGHANRVSGIGFIDAGRTVVSGGADGAMKFWDLTTGREVGAVFPHAVSGINHGIGALACSPDGRTIATGADDGQVKLWEAATGQHRATLTLGSRGQVTKVTSLSMALGGQALAAGGSRGGAGEAALWALYTPAPMLPVRMRPTLWQDLSGDGATAYRAILTVAAHPREAVALLRQRLHPVTLTPGVRKDCDRLLAALDNENFEVREDAHRRLEAMSPWIERYLRKALTGTRSLELHRRLEALIGKIGPSTLPLLRAIEALEHTAAPESRQLLRQLADGEPDARITREAGLALERLHRSANPAP
jgi:hypothetical protein